MQVIKLKAKYSSVECVYHQISGAVNDEKIIDEGSQQLFLQGSFNYQDVVPYTVSDLGNILVLVV